MAEKLLKKIPFFILGVLPGYILNLPSFITICVDLLLVVNARTFLFVSMLHNPFNAYY